ncbi:MAG: acyltransferase domain-containing protein, partial [Acidobacteriia bacterium]|nr:acyltransferase domain-containing protein [Terriglobia bacterium]
MPPADGFQRRKKGCFVAASKTVFMFSGQGSQYFQMGRGLYDNNKTFREWMIRLDGIARDLCGRSVIEALYSDAQRRADPFERTLLTHPAIFMVEYSLAQSLICSGVLPDMVLGVSLGSFAAAAVAGFIDAIGPRRRVGLQRSPEHGLGAQRRDRHRMAAAAERLDAPVAGFEHQDRLVGPDRDERRRAEPARAGPRPGRHEGPWRLRVGQFLRRQLQDLQRVIPAVHRHHVAVAVDGERGRVDGKFAETPAGREAEPARRVVHRHRRRGHRRHLAQVEAARAIAARVEEEASGPEHAGCALRGPQIEQPHALAVAGRRRHVAGLRPQRARVVRKRLEADALHREQLGLRRVVVDRWNVEAGRFPRVAEQAEVVADRDAVQPLEHVPGRPGAQVLHRCGRSLLGRLPEVSGPPARRPVGQQLAVQVGGVGAERIALLFDADLHHKGWVAVLVFAVDQVRDAARLALADTPAIGIRHRDDEVHRAAHRYLIPFDRDRGDLGVADRGRVGPRRVGAVLGGEQARGRGGRKLASRDRHQRDLDVHRHGHVELDDARRPDDLADRLGELLDHRLERRHLERLAGDRDRLGGLLGAEPGGELAHHLGGGEHLAHQAVGERGERRRYIVAEIGRAGEQVLGDREHREGGRE